MLLLILQRKFGIKWFKTALHKQLSEVLNERMNAVKVRGAYAPLYKLLTLGL